MNIVDIEKVDTQSLISNGLQEDEVVELIWVHRNTRCKVLSYAIVSSIKEDSDADNSNQIIERIASILKTPEDLEIACDAVQTQYRSDLLWSVLNTGKLDKRILVVLLDDKYLLERLKPDPLWVDEALWHRITFILNSSLNRLYSIEELVPQPMPKHLSARSALGSALDSNRLTYDAVVELREMYPNDKYIQQKTSEVLSKKLITTA